MAKIIRRGIISPVNKDCRNQRTTPVELRDGSDCEQRDNPQNNTDGDSCDPIAGNDWEFVPESPGMNEPECEPEEPECDMDSTGYHKNKPSQLLTGDEDGKCISPYSRGVGNLDDVLNDRLDDLLDLTGVKVTLLRRQFTGVRCLCYSSARGSSRSDCPICFGTSFVPGYIPYNEPTDPLGRIKIRLEPFDEKTTLNKYGITQDVTANGWTKSLPIVAQKDVLIIYNDSGEEEFRYELKSVSRNKTFQGSNGAQKFSMIRLDPMHVIYDYDPYAIPDLADIEIDVEDDDPTTPRIYDTLGEEDDGQYANDLEDKYGDAAFSSMYTEGYKVSYEENYKRALNGIEAMITPDFNGDGKTDPEYGPVYYASNGQKIKFSTPQNTELNPGINPIEVIEAEQKRFYILGWKDGSRDGYKDAQRELENRRNS